MGQKEKLITRFKRQPKDFTFSELGKLFWYFGFRLSESHSGSRVRFINSEKNLQFRMHKPHPSKIVKRYIIKQVNEFLTIHKFI